MYVFSTMEKDSKEENKTYGALFRGAPAGTPPRS
jgi:hypothetical protein